MGITVNLDADLVGAARTHSAVQSRSVPKQIEYWAKIGKVAEENPELSYHVIKEILIGLEEVKNNQITEYTGKL